MTVEKAQRQELPAYAKHLSMRPTSHPSPLNPTPLSKGKNGAKPGYPTGRAQCSVCAEQLLQPQQESFPGRLDNALVVGMTSIYPKRLHAPRRRLLCTELQGCLARLRGVFLNFSQLLQNLKVVGQYFGMCWALLSVSGRDCSYLDLP